MNFLERPSEVFLHHQAESVESVLHRASTYPVYLSQPTDDSNQVFLSPDPKNRNTILLAEKDSTPKWFFKIPISKLPVDRVSAKPQLLQSLSPGSSNMTACLDHSGSTSSAPIIRFSPCPSSSFSRTPSSLLWLIYRTSESHEDDDNEEKEDHHESSRSNSSPITLAITPASNVSPLCVGIHDDDSVKKALLPPVWKKCDDDEGIWRINSTSVDLLSHV